MTSQEEGCRTRCIFCRICDGVESETNLLHQDDEFIVFRDIRPAAPHHYLVVPRKHFNDAKNLPVQEIPMMKRMLDLGTKFLTDEGGLPESARFGFHWPPFHSVKHLHMHVIAPESEMGFFSQVIFRPDSYWFVSAEIAIQRLQQKNEL